MTSNQDDTRDGKGRVRPGPSPSPHSRPHFPPAVMAPLGALVLLVAGVASSVFGTQAHQYSSAAALAFVSALGSFLGVIVTVGMSPKPARRPAEWVTEALAGAAGLALAPWIVMANRYTDAPPGSEVVFFSVAAWGAMLALALAFSARERVTRIGGAVLALVGAAAVVANWERPSSFSPFVRFAREELLMLLAGAMWVALVLVLLAASRRGSLAGAALRASLGGIGGGAVLVAVSALSGGLTAADFAVPGVWAFGVAVAFATAGMIIVLQSRSAALIAGVYLIIPAAMSLLLLLESVLGVRGPNPLLEGPILGATLATLAGLYLTAAPTPADGSRGATSLRPLALILAAAAVVSAVAALALPGMAASVQGLRADGTQFQASFDLFGYEVAGAWLAFGIAVSALGIAFGRSSKRALWAQSAAVAAGSATWLLIADTPLRTLTAFIPSDVQVDYGSEFARIDFIGGPSILALVALGGALLAVAVTLAYRARPSATAGGATRNREVVSS